MNMGQPDSPFPLNTLVLCIVVVYVLKKKGIAFCTSGFKVGKFASEPKLQPLANTCSTFNLENVRLVFIASKLF